MVPCEFDSEIGVNGEYPSLPDDPFVPMLLEYVCAPVAVEGRPELLLTPLPKEALVGLLEARPPRDGILE